MWNNTPPCIKYIPTKYEGTGPFKTKFFDEQSIIELIGQDKSDLILIHDIPPCPNAYTKYEDTCDKIVLLEYCFTLVASELLILSLDLVDLLH
jgi:hypothetical protein